MSLPVNRQVRILVGDTNPASYRKEDWEINEVVTLAVPLVEIDYYQGYALVTSGYVYDGTTESGITPTPDAQTKLLLAYRSAIILHENEIASSQTNAIYVKDGDTTIDTTKGSSSRQKALDSLYQHYIDLLTSLTINDINGAKGFRTDMYDSEEI